MKYVVTHCTFDGEAGGNPLWHSCILFSKLDETTKMLEVVDTWGFYGLPTTNNSNSYLNQFKKKIGMDVDLNGNHGWLRHEEVRWLDLGCGLHGSSFEVTEDQFKTLQQECLKMVADQEQAVKEIVDAQGLKGKPPGKERIYSHEQFSTLFLKLEQIKAEQNKRPSRLKPFELRMKWGITGLDLSSSSTCKTQAVGLLSKVLDPEQIERLTEFGKHPSIPRYSGSTESIYLHSTGPVRAHKKASGEVVYFRDFKDPGVRLFWTVPPQDIEALSDETINMVEMDPEHLDEVKGLVRKLQRAEWVLRNSVVPEKYQAYQTALIDQIISTYRAFSTVEPRPAEPKVSGWKGFAMSLFLAPRNQDEKALLAKIGNAKMLLNSMYMAMVDQWGIDDTLPMENHAENASYEEGVEVPLSNPVEAVTFYLATPNKKNLCKVIGRNYVEDNFVLEDSEEDDSEEVNAKKSEDTKEANQEQSALSSMGAPR